MRLGAGIEITNRIKIDYEAEPTGLSEPPDGVCGVFISDSGRRPR